MATKPRRFWRGLRHEMEPEGVTWLGESRVVKALERAEARAVAGHGPVEGPPTTDDQAPTADGPPTAEVPAVAAPNPTGDDGTADAAGAVAVVPDVPPRAASPFRRKKTPRETSPLEAAGAATAALVAEQAASQESIVTDTAIEEEAPAGELGAPPGRRFGWLGTKHVATAVAIILAAEVGYIVHLNTSSTSSTTPKTQALPKLTVPAPASTLPSASLPVATPTTAAPATKAASAPPAPAPVHSVVAAPATTPAPPPQPCTAADLSFTTTTDRASYSAGEPVVVVTKVTDISSCVFTPTAPAGSSCATSISVDRAGGGAVPMGPESCTPPAASTLNPGSTETLSATLPPGELAPGSYTAVGTWGWSSGQGVATATPASPAFTVS